MDAEIDPLIAEVVAALVAVMRLMVDNPEAVTVTPVTQGSTTLFVVRAGRSDASKLIGTGGRSARSLRVLLANMAMAQKRVFSIDIDGI